MPGQVLARVWPKPCHTRILRPRGRSIRRSLGGFVPTLRLGNRMIWHFRYAAYRIGCGMIWITRGSLIDEGASVISVLTMISTRASSQKSVRKNQRGCAQRADFCDFLILPDRNLFLNAVAGVALRRIRKTVHYHGLLGVDGV